MDGVTRLIAEFAAVGLGGRVLVTGGEPFLFASELAMMSEVTHAHGLRFGVETNAFWAKTPKIARRLLERYAVDALIISASRFHKVYIPPKRVLTAYRSAQVMGIQAEVRVSTVAGERLDGALTSLIEAIAPADLTREPVAGFGRAADLVAPQPPIQPAPDNPMRCPSEGPILMEDGRIDPCCGPLTALDRHALDIGNVHTVGGIDRMRRDPVFTTLHRDGLRAFVDALEARGLPARHHLAKGDVCAVCAAIMQDPALARGIAEMRAAETSESPRRIQQA